MSAAGPSGSAVFNTSANEGFDFTLRLKKRLMQMYRTLSKGIQMAFLQPIPVVEHPNDPIEMRVLGEIFVALNSLEQDHANLTTEEAQSQIKGIRMQVGTYLLARQQAE